MDCAMMRCFCKKIRSHHCKIVLLDDQELLQEIQDNTRGQEILDIVFRHLNLIETAYFGLRYLDASNQTHWLDPEKKIVKQLKGTNPFSLYFGVKFYAADPCKLVEEITRYQFFLQVKQDVLQGRLPVTFDEAAELGAYVVQSELGDFDPRRHSPGYVSEFRFLANQTLELESRIEELHKGLIGQLPPAAEMSFLDKVKWLDMYGVDLHPVLGEDNVEYFLGLTPSGIIVLRNKSKVGNYYWPRISKIYFKGRYFMIRISDKNVSEAKNEESTYGFETPSKPACKHLWKCCVEHHAFFRLIQVSNTTAPDLFALGSKFRYSGRTEKQAQADTQMRLRSPPQFSRTPSRRYQRRIIEGSADVPKIEDRENIAPTEAKMITIPLPVNSIYRSTCSIPAALPSHRAESPRSTRSAPWSQPHVRGLYNSGTSPRSVRSAGNTAHLLHKLTHRSPSVDSQSSNDSRSCKRHRRHRSRRGSDNESELSKCSSRSHHRHRRRSHSKRDGESDKEHRSHHRHRHKSSSSSRHRHGSQYELVDSEAQWREVQRRQAAGGSGVHQATVINNKDRRSGYMNSGMETESEMSYHHKRKQKKHRSRSRSPEGANKTRLPEELKKHLEFALIDTAGMSETQLREIPYTVIETSSKARKHSPNSRRKSSSGRKSKSGLDENRKSTITESPPPPYTPIRDDPHADLQQTKHSINHISSGDSGNFSNTGPGSNSSSTSNSALGEFLNKPPNGLPLGSSNHSPAGSVNRSRIIDFKSPSLQNIVGSQYFSSGQNSSPKLTLSTKPVGNQSSALYGKPSAILGNTSWCNAPLRSSHSNVYTKTYEDFDYLQISDRRESYNRLYHQNSLGSLRQLRDTQPNTSLPPLPYNQNNQRTTRLIHDVAPKSSTRSENRNPPDLDSRRNKESVRQVDDTRTEWRRTSNNNVEDTRRRAGRQQPPPRNTRNHYNMNGCSMSDRFTDHDSIQEDEEPNDENSNNVLDDEPTAISDDNSNTPGNTQRDDDNRTARRPYRKTQNGKGHLHELRTEL